MHSVEMIDRKPATSIISYVQCKPVLAQSRRDMPKETILRKNTKMGEAAARFRKPVNGVFRHNARHGMTIVVNVRGVSWRKHPYTVSSPEGSASVVHTGF
jgi:hypothetical protein